MNNNSRPSDSASTSQTTASQHTPTTTVTPQEIIQLWEAAAGDTITLYRPRNAPTIPLEYSDITPHTTLTDSTGSPGVQQTSQPASNSPQTTLPGTDNTAATGQARYRHGTSAAVDSTSEWEHPSDDSTEHVGQSSIAAVNIIPNPLPVTITSIATTGNTRYITAELADAAEPSLPHCIDAVTITVASPIAPSNSPVEFKPPADIPLPVVEFHVDPTASPRNTTYLPPVVVTRTERINAGSPEYRHPAVPTSGGIFNYSGRRVHALLTPAGVVRLYARTDDTDVAESLDAFDRTASHTRMVEQLSLPDFRRFVDSNAIQPRSSRAGSALESW